MKYLGDNCITRAILATLALGVLSVGIISMTTMSHDNMMASKNCPISMDGGDCPQSSESSACVDYHLGIMQNLSSALPQNFGAELLGLMLVSLLALAVFGIFDKTYHFYCRLKIRFKQFLEQTLGVFQDQLGFWLAIIQKKDPSYAFTIA
jgi:hypothetical protein